MSREPLPIEFGIIGPGEGEILTPVAGETLCLDAGAMVLVLTSCSAQLGIELRSAYVGGEGSEEVAVAESAVHGGGPAALRNRILTVGGDALLDRRRVLLYDHLQVVQDLAEAEGGWNLGFEGIERALAALEALAPE